MTMVVVSLLAVRAMGFAQDATTPVDQEQRLQLAIASEDYPVTPGDVYRLTYRQADTPVTNDFLVESNYTINMKVFGSLSATGMTFAQLKPVVEKAVATAYPRSMPSLAIYSLGVFQVYLTGETPQSQAIVAWGLSKLSQIVETRRGPLASLRSIRVTAKDGRQKTFDLFRAYRFGSVDQDPYMKPGDTIALSRAERRVDVEGAVHRPGVYELLPNEQMRELVELYADGLANNSDVSRLRIERTSGDRAKVLYVSLADAYKQGTPLDNGDIVTIPTLTESLPVVSFEGAVNAQTTASVMSTPAPEQAASGALPAYNRVLYTFKEGETLSDAVRAIHGSIAPLADLSSASVIRQGRADPITVDLRELLASRVSPSDMVLQPNDRIVIPLLSFSVFVSGAVGKPGTYPYAPDRTYEYYVTLAGGSNQDAPEKILITDVHGKMRDQKEVIRTEDRIYVIPAEVMVQGAVFAPGTFAYREGLPVTYYVNLAGGINPEKNREETVLVYDSLGNRRKADEPVRPGDRIYAPDNSFLYQVVVQGAVLAPGSFPFREGLPVSYYVNLAGGVDPQKNPEGTLLVYDSSGVGRPDTEPVRPGDRVYVPDTTIGKFVMVEGAVAAPGSFAFRSGLPASYYVNLAGGIDAERNKDGSFVVYDSAGNRRNLKEALSPGDRIVAPTNSFMYSFNRYTPIVTTLMAIVTTTFTILEFFFLQRTAP